MGEPESRTAEEKAKSFARLIELKHEHMARAGSRGKPRRPSGDQSLRASRRTLSPADFETLGVLGRGAFAEVTLARKKDTSQVYAVKKMTKEDLVSRGHVERAWTEWMVQTEADGNDWLVKLHFCFQTHEHVYLVMDYVPGGDLMGLLMRLDVLPEAQARFYAAEAVQAIASLHRLGYAHRDIKPDNLLLDRDGHVKLADLGLAKCVASHLKIAHTPTRSGGGGSAAAGGCSAAGNSMMAGRPEPPAEPATIPPPGVGVGAGGAGGAVGRNACCCGSGLHSGQAAAAASSPSSSRIIAAVGSAAVAIGSAAASASGLVGAGAAPMPRPAAIDVSDGATAATRELASPAAMTAEAGAGSASCPSCGSSASSAAASAASSTASSPSANLPRPAALVSPIADSVVGGHGSSHPASSAGSMSTSSDPTATSSAAAAISSPSMVPTASTPPLRTRAEMFSRVGTPDYMAPEVLLRSGYGTECDWWSLGCILFEMLVGYAPFYAETPSETADRILRHETTLEFPPEASHLSDDARDLVRNLLRNKGERLSVEAIRAHPFFAGVDWNTLRCQPPPYTPTITSETDTQHFEEFEPLPPEPPHELEPLTLPSASSRASGAPPPSPQRDQRTVMFAGFQYRRAP